MHDCDFSQQSKMFHLSFCVISMERREVVGSAMWSNQVQVFVNWLLLHCWAFFCNSLHHHYIVSGFCRCWQLAQAKISSLWRRCDICLRITIKVTHVWFYSFNPHGLKPDLCAFGWSHDQNPLPFHLSLRKWQNETNHGPLFSRLWPKIFY